MRIIANFSALTLAERNFELAITIYFFKIKVRISEKKISVPEKSNEEDRNNIFQQVSVKKDDQFKSLKLKV